MNERKVYVIGRDTSYADFIEKAVLIDDLEKADIVLFTGGEDVSPSIYGEEPHYTTFSNFDRDIREMAVFKKALHIPKIGICRGSQLLTALNGGKLIQNIENHAIGGTHPIKFDDGDVIDITSTHHQMMYPFNLPKRNYNLIAWSKDKLSSFYSGTINEEEIKDIEKEPEIVYYPKTKSLCIQGHPEYMPKDSMMVIKVNELIERLWQI